MGAEAVGSWETESRSSDGAGGSPVTLGVSEDQGHEDACPWRVYWEEQRAAGRGGLLPIAAAPFILILRTPSPAVPGPQPFPVECTCPSWGHRKPQKTLLCCMDRSVVGMFLAQDAGWRPG